MANWLPGVFFHRLIFFCICICLLQNVPKKKSTIKFFGFKLFLVQGKENGKRITTPCFSLCVCVWPPFVIVFMFLCSCFCVFRCSGCLGFSSCVCFQFFVFYVFRFSMVLGFFMVSGFPVVSLLCNQ